MKFGVVVFPGSNCDQDCYDVMKDVLGQQVEFVWHKQNRSLSDFDCVILPGGFSYGDYLRTGAIAQFSPIMSSIKDYASVGGLILGICNGFQILLESGLLPGAMLKNTSLKFICKYVYIRVENNHVAFTRNLKVGTVLSIPIAHAEGNYYADELTMDSLNKNRQVIFRYCDEKGQNHASANPNGSLENVAGICNRNGNVLGMMPHPERSSELVLGSESGKYIFQSMIDYLEQKNLIKNS
ncbi:MAG: phosphoribosylformylglycinamidine synthase subunit PurQ [Chlamydiota bacterium]|nr:phosphoribosylformylglycinamidine synthase subunit PurQ [Chlamydiota bacterium]